MFKSEHEQIKKYLHMVEKIYRKIENGENQSVNGRFKFRSKGLGNCLVILSAEKNKLLGVFVDDDYNERIAFNFLEELEMIIITESE